MRVVERERDLRADRDEDVAARVLLQRLPQRAAGQVLHRDEVLTLVRADLEDRDDVGVAERGERLGLLAQPALRVAVEQLERDVALEGRVVGQEDRAHAAVAELPHDAIAADGDHV